MVKSVLQERIKTTGQPPSDAIAYVNKALDKRGLTAFDAGNEQARQRAVALTVGVSLDRFSQDETGTAALRGIFHFSGRRKYTPECRHYVVAEHKWFG